ncbi:MAG TPA: sigma-70 family RNA polymerase sigma factor [Gemmataceae bacterium]|nr:sigma-70 family RNA polymerase sigma factor [Gemmataceae bacterium]
MSRVATNGSLAPPAHKALLYHFCRLQLPFLRLSLATFENNLQRCFALFQAKRTVPAGPDSWSQFLGSLYAVDWFTCVACLEGQPRAWEQLFAAKATRSECLFVDALRARAVRLFPRDQERQENAVQDFWGYLLAGEREGAVPILARYDGQRPLVPWLIRVFQNKHLSDLRQNKGTKSLPEDDLDAPEIPLGQESDARWHELFRQAAHEWLEEQDEKDLLLLGLRLRYRLSQRQVAGLLGIHEGNVSRHTSRLRDDCLEQISNKLVECGWTGEDLSGLVLKEMDSLILEEPRLEAGRLAVFLARRGQKLPEKTEPNP